MKAFIFRNKNLYFVNYQEVTFLIATKKYVMRVKKKWAAYLKKTKKEAYSIYFADASIFQKKYTLEELLSDLPEAIGQKALRYKNPQAAFNHVVGRLLLREALKEGGYPSSFLKNITFSPTGQPLLDGVFSFSIAHSGQYVVCAISKKGKIGIDIEVIRPIVAAHLRHWFTAAEWAFIQAAVDPKRQLFKLWTKKEAVLKTFGAGIGAFKKVELVGEDRAVFDGQYACHLVPVEMGGWSDVLGWICVYRPEKTLRLKNSN